ncbi:hypothetical protein [Actinocorallia libanotica]
MVVHLHEPGRRQRPGSGHDEPTVYDGLRAVLLLLLTGIDALLTALIGIRPLAPALSRLGHVIADEYRAGRHGYVDAEVVDDPECEVEP